MLTIKILGGSGYISSNIINVFINSFNIIIYSSNLDYISKNKKIYKNKLIYFDLLNKDSLKGIFKNDDLIINCSYLNKHSNSNIDAIENLIYEINLFSNIKIIHLSTAVVVGFKINGIIDEDVIPKPHNQYQSIKLNIENLLINKLSNNNKLLILRPTEVIGCGREGIIKKIYELNFYSSIVAFLILKNRKFNLLPVENLIELIKIVVTNNLIQNNIILVSNDDEACNNFKDIFNIIFKKKYGFTLRYMPCFTPLMLKLIFKLLSNHSHPIRTYKSKYFTSKDFSVVELNSVVEKLLSKLNSNKN
jgi:nucleoside-diphosphate-sugar epimerase